MGDFTLVPPVTCAVNTMAVRVLYSILGVSQSLLFCMMLFYLRRYLQSKSKSRRPLVASFSLVISTLSFITLAIIRATFPESSGIGFSVVTTVIFCFGAGGFWAYIMVFTVYVLDMAVLKVRSQSIGIEATTREMAKRIKSAFPVLIFLAVLFSFTPLLLLATNDKWARFFITLVHFEGLACLSLFLAWFVMHKLTKPIIADLDFALSASSSSSLNSASLHQARSKLEKTRTESRQQALFNFVSATIFGVLPGMQQLASYWEPVAFTAASWVAIVALLLILPSPPLNHVAPEMMGSQIRMRLVESIAQDRNMVISVYREGVIGSTFDVDEAERLMGNVDLVSDNHGVINVRTRHTRVYKIKDTLLGKINPDLNSKLFALFRHWIKLGRKAIWLPLFLLWAFGSAAAIPTMMGVLPAETSFFFIPVIILYCVAGVGIINMEITKAILRTSVFWIRSLSALVSFICMCVILRDARIMIALGIFLLQIFVALGDSLAGEFSLFRVATLIQLLGSLIIFDLVLFLDLISYTYFTVAPSTFFDWALIQLGRDLYLGTIVVLFFDLSFALRGTQRRFASIHDPIKYVLRTFNDMRDAAAGEIVSLATPSMSRVEMRSGFLAEKPEAAAGVRPHVYVYVDQICLSQNDAMICHLLGPERGEQMFHVLDGRIGTAFDFIISIFLFPCILFPLYPNFLFFAFPFIIFHPLRAFLLSSKTIMILVLQRRVVQVQICFVLIWGTLWISVFPTILAVCGIIFVSTSLKELFKDASLRKRTKRSLLLTKILIGIAALVVSGFLIAGICPDPLFHYVDFRPDTRNFRESNASRIPYSDSPSVVDLYQQTADLGISLGAGHLLTSFLLFWNLADDELATVHMAVFPQFVD